MNCPNGHGAMKLVGDFWFCGKCRHSVLAPNFERLPSVLAIPLRDFYAETNPIVRVHMMCETAEIVTRFIVIVFLGEARRILNNEPLPDTLLKELQLDIERPTFGKWVRLADVLAKWLEGKDLVLPKFKSTGRN